jgi:hypothetical protein
MFEPNTTCDIYRTGTAPPASPAVSGVQILLISDFERGQEKDGTKWSHYMLCALDTDVRDDWDEGTPSLTNDTVWIPDKDGVEYRVQFVTQLYRGTPDEQKKVYLARAGVTWPKNDGL